MPSLRPLPIVAAVLACESVLALVGSEVSYQAERHQLSNSGLLGVLLRSVGAPMAAPWRPADWDYGGPAALIGLACYLLLLAGAVWIVVRGARPERAFGVIFLGTWAASGLALTAGEFVRLQLTGDGLRLGGRESLATALGYAPSFADHAAYFGWLPAVIAATVALLHRRWHATVE